MAITIKPNISTKLAPSSLSSDYKTLTIDKPNNIGDYTLNVIIKYGYGDIINSTGIAGSVVAANNNKFSFNLNNISSYFKTYVGYQLFFYYAKNGEKGPYTISNLYLIPNSGNANLTVNNETATFTYENQYDPIVELELIHKYYSYELEKTNPKINYDEQLDPSNVKVTSILHKYIGDFSDNDAKRTIRYSYTTLNGENKSDNAIGNKDFFINVGRTGPQIISPSSSDLDLIKQKENGYYKYNLPDNTKMFYVYDPNSHRGYGIEQVLWEKEIEDEETFIDYNIEHNKEVGYLFKIVDGDAVSYKSLVAKVDFDHYCLYDSDEHYVIKFNPKVTSFKETVQETKTDTIGGQYPVIFRNGTVKYKEFSIGGLISALVENEENEVDRAGTGSKTENGITEDRNATITINNDKPTDIVGENIKRERDYKLNLLTWLNNGKPKVFKSPYEGNYIVRLMNVQLSPEETTSRMIHSFTAQAVEIAEYNYDNLIKYDLLKIDFE